MAPLTRITVDPDVIGGKPCIRSLRVTVGAIGSLVTAGRTVPEILAAYPYPEENDIREAFSTQRAASKTPSRNALGQRLGMIRNRFRKSMRYVSKSS